MNSGIVASGYAPPQMPGGLLGRPSFLPMPTGIRNYETFSPASIPNLAAWYDVSVESSLTLNGNQISRMNDLSGNGRNLAQSTASRQPTLTRLARNGLSVAVWNSTALMTFPSSAATEIYRITSQSIFWAIFPSATQSGNRRVLTQIVTGQTVDYGGTNFFIPPFFTGSTNLFVYANNTFQALVTVPAGSPLVVSCVHTGSAMTTQANRLPIGSGTSTLNTSIGLIELGDATDGAFTGQFCEAIVYNNRALTQHERVSVMQYLASKWGVPQS